MANINRVVEKRDYGSNLARELARADVELKPSEFQAIRFAAIVGVPLVMILLSPLIAFLGNPIMWIGGIVFGFWVPKFWLGRRKSKRLKAFNSGLSDVIMLLVNSLRAGSSFLQSVEMVCREAALSNFIAAIVQAEQLGVPIAKVLQVQSEQLRIERRQRAEEMAAKAPIKMLFPLVGCIFPSMFIVILGPAVILIALNMSTT